MREYKPNQPKIVCRGVAGHLIIQDDERAMDGGARRVESPMRTGRPCMALFYVDLHESTRAKSSLALSSTHIDSSAVFLRKGFKDFGAPPSNLPSNCFDVSTCFNYFEKNMENTRKQHQHRKPQC